ncbi:MAG TPA: response regulator [Gemmatimonadaceae bacterium]|jgi:CheY-like chemotaxis protein|nr:response regulator [Gemmatimonadaceae bacterium]
MANPPETILLVDDEETVRRFGSRVLTKHGFTVLSAETGAEALAAAGRHGSAIHLLLTDVMMPGMNGCDLAERMIALQPSLRVLFISGYAEDSLADHLRRVGQAAFLGKPFKPKALVTKVRELLDAPASISRRHLDDIS